MNKKRICIITPSFPRFKDDPTEAGVLSEDFATLLNESFEVFVLTPFKKRSVSDDRNFHIHYFKWLGDEIALTSLKPKNPIHFLKISSIVILGILHTVNFMKTNKIDYCIAMWAIPSGLFAWISKVFLKINYSTWVLGSDIWRMSDYPFGKTLVKKILVNANNIFADGQSLINIVEKLTNRKCKFLSSARILNKETHTLDYKKYNSKKINFMYLGRYQKNKGPDLLLKAISLLTDEEKKKVDFHFFGGGMSSSESLEKEMLKLRKELKIESNTEINGYLEGKYVFSHMKCCDFVIIPSRLESIPLVLSDSMQAKKPVIVTDVGDMGKLVREFKVGYVVKPTPEDIVQGIRKAIISVEKKVEFEEGITKLEQFLNLRKSVNEIIKVIENNLA